MGLPVMSEVSRIGEDGYYTTEQSIFEIFHAERLADTMRDEAGRIENQAETEGGTAAKRTEKIKRNISNGESQIELLQDMLEDIPGSICVLRWTDEHFEPIAMSKEFSRILQIEGDSRQSIYSMKQILHLHPDDQIRLDHYALECIQNNKSMDITIRFQYEPDRDYCWINLKGKVQQQKDGSKLCYVSCHDVTREHELECRLKSSDYSFQTVLENCHIYCGKYDVRKKISYFNRVIQQDFGLPRQLKIDQILESHILSQEVSQQLRDMFYKMSTEKRDVMTLEMPIRHVNGEQMWIRQIYTVVERDERKNPLTIISTALDITKNKQAEQRFRTENAYQQIMDQDTLTMIRMNVTHWMILDCMGECKGLDRHFGHFLETLQETIPDKKMRTAFQQMFQQQNMLRKFESGQNKLTYTFRSRRASGGVIWMEITADMIQRGDGEILALVQVKDINQQVIVDQVRNSMIDRFVDFVAYYALADGSSYIFSENEKYDFTSDIEKGALQKLSNAIRRNLSCDEWEALQSQLNLKTMIQNLDHISNYQYSYQIKENGLRTKRVNYFYLDQNRDVIVISQQDITDMIQEEVHQKEELKRALDLAIHASNTRDEFLSNMSHDLRTPLNGIIGASELAKDLVVGHPELAEEYLNAIYSSGHLMLNLVNDILDMGKLEYGKQELETIQIDWDILSDQLWQKMEPICREKEIQLEVNLADMPYVIGDFYQLNQVLQNLLANAVKYTKSGGRIECQVAESQMIRDTFLVTIMVRDTGIGIGTEFQQHMYEPFSRENNEVNAQEMGSGFGLAIARSRIELMGGSIRCESKKGDGTTFYVTLPFLSNQEIPASKNRKKDPAGQKILRGCKVLLVEDHPLNAKIVKRLLESKDVVVKHVINGQEAVDCFCQSELFYYDIILMDISMPVMDGIEATRQIRAMERSDAHLIPIIALTANAFERDIQRGKVAGMNEHLTKPLNSGKLFDVLQDFCQ